MSSVELCYDDGIYPFNRIDMTIADYGVSDDVYVVTSDKIDAVFKNNGRLKIEIDRLTEENKRLAVECERLRCGLNNIRSDCDKARNLKDRGDWYQYLACGIADAAEEALNE